MLVWGLNGLVYASPLPVTRKIKDELSGLFLSTPGRGIIAAVLHCKDRPTQPNMQDSINIYME